ncbi:hypothetical protein [Wolbachia endosymbiont (group A) of Bibio marci]|nr:hypothetical protein [Wolbachia endosymbiont (group A) of Bibio marci]
MIFIVNYYQYKVRCNKAHWDPAKLVSVKVANLTLKHNVLDEIA